MCDEYFKWRVSKEKLNSSSNCKLIGEEALDTIEWIRYIYDRQDDDYI